MFSGILNMTILSVVEIEETRRTTRSTALSLSACVPLLLLLLAKRRAGGVR